MKVIVALSGGVDSAVAALLLKQKGYELIGVHMRNWDVALSEGRDGCMSEEDYLDVKKICEVLDIPLYTYNFVAEYWEQVFRPYISSLEKNLSINPDINCNFHIKFGVLLDRVIEDFGEDIKLATGHWAKVTEDKGRFYLDICSNPDKDQTYFLSSLNEKQLSKAMFPLYSITSKQEVRNKAREVGIHVWNKRDSVGICFIGKRNYREFIGNYIESKEGDLVDIEDGRVLGKHKGSHLYVLHQRDGLYLKGYEEKYYVCGKDVDRNIVYLCRKTLLSKYLYKSISRCSCMHWINEDMRVKVGEEVYVKIRHSTLFIRVKVIKFEGDECLIEHKRMYITTPGQAIVFYSLDKRRCLGMGIYLS